MTSESDRQRLLRIAREAIAAHVGGEPAPRSGEGDLASRCGGAFVTIRKAGNKPATAEVGAWDHAGRLVAFRRTVIR